MENMILEAHAREAEGKLISNSVHETNNNNEELYEALWPKSNTGNERFQWSLKGQTSAPCKKNSWKTDMHTNTHIKLNWQIWFKD